MEYITKRPPGNCELLPTVADARSGPEVVEWTGIHGGYLYAVVKFNRLIAEKVVILTHEHNIKHIYSYHIYIICF